MEAADFTGGERTRGEEHEDTVPRVKERPIRQDKRPTWSQEQDLFSQARGESLLIHRASGREFRR